MREIVKGIRRELRKRVTTETGFTTKHDGYESADVMVDIDTHQIAKDLGLRAMGNRSGKAKYCYGAITVTVVRRQRCAD